MKQSTIQIGKEFEEQAKGILSREGYEVLEHSSNKNWGSPYDFIVSHSNQKYYVEVRGRKTDKKTCIFSLTKSKIHRLRDLDKPVLILLIIGENHLIMALENIQSHARKTYINGKKIYFFEVEDRDPTELLIKCFNCFHSWTTKSKKIMVTCGGCGRKINKLKYLREQGVQEKLK